MSHLRPDLFRQSFQDRSLIFASVAEATLDNLIYVVWRRIVNRLCTRSSHGFIFSKWLTEIYFVCHFLFQMNYLQHFGATFSERFFGLKRKSLKNEGNPRLGNKEVLLSLIFTTGARYVMEKLREINQNLQRKSFMNASSGIIMANYVASIVQYVRFLSGKTDAVTPFHLAAGVKLEYSNEAALQTGNTLWDFMSQALENSLGLSAFFFQFFQWWQTNRNGTGSKITVPPPPMKYEYDVDVGNVCPLCLFNIRDKSLLSVSGYIFCYKCISDFVGKFKKCPITNMPAELSRLIQLQE